MRRYHATPSATEKFGFKLNYIFLSITYSLPTLPETVVLHILRPSKITMEEDDMGDNDTALILAAAMMEEGAELPASELRDNELCALCTEVQAMLGQPEVAPPELAVT